MPTYNQVIKNGNIPIIINKIIVKYLHMLEDVYNQIKDEMLKDILNSLEIKE